VIAGLLLAAGRSTRFSGDKLVARLQGRPVLSWSASALAAGVDALYVVTPPDSQARVAALGGLDARIVEHAGRDAGLASSIIAGISALPLEVEAAVIALADQPGVSSATVRRLCDRWRAGGAAAVVPRYRDGRGHPVLFGRATFGALAMLEGDTGARAVLEALGDGLAIVDVAGPMPADVDTPDALRALEADWQR
jgi:molybdenum cofactor cytidylyltransferase